MMEEFINGLLISISIFFPARNTQNFPIESWTVDIIVFESWHELRSYSICAFAIQTAFRLQYYSLPFMKREKKNKSRIFPESMNQGMKKNQQSLESAPKKSHFHEFTTNASEAS